MAQFIRPGKAADATVHFARGQSERPRGIGLSALALLALLVGNLIQDLLELHLATPPGSSASPGANLAWGPVAYELLRVGVYLGVGVLCIWQLWRGRSWARLLALLWSLATVARALSFLSEHNFDPAALMGRPLRFFQAVLAAVLLYWLNTPNVRAWYRRSSARAGDLIADHLVGRLCTGLEHHSDLEVWRLYFEHDAELVLRCPWRIVLDDNLAFATAHEEDAPWANQAARSAFADTADQRPSEAVPAPGHSPQEARRLLENLRVRAVRLAPRSSDLFVSFEMGIELQTWSRSGPLPAARTAASPGAPNPAGGMAPAPRPGAAPAAAPGTPLWEYSDPGFTCIANDTGTKLAVVMTEPER